MPNQPHHPACRVPALLSAEKPNVEASSCSEERDAGDARAGTPPHQVPADCQGGAWPGVRTRRGGNDVTRPPPPPPTGDYRAGRRRR